MVLTVSDFLNEKGAVELICEVKPRGSRQNELEEALFLSENTLRKRLAQAVEVELLTRAPAPGEPGRTHYFLLAKQGIMLRAALDHLGTTTTYEAYRDARLEFIKRAEEGRKWVEQNPESTQPSQRRLDSLYVARATLSLDVFRNHDDFPNADETRGFGMGDMWAAHERATREDDS
ncbi:winged helix-turn-helix transcriptional regulator [Halomarina rubra]|uniref:Winged helix-turn-helix transcriptional regulator n=2 Tax=Halomarina rubra TaxID=2071873 RepID=A0ABD6B1Z6_9EURY